MGKGKLSLLHNAPKILNAHKKYDIIFMKDGDKNAGNIYYSGLLPHIR